MFLLRILIFKGLTVQRFYKSFGAKGLISNGLIHYEFDRKWKAAIEIINPTRREAQHLPRWTEKNHLKSS
jgi:hypothetical protein